MNPEIPLEVHDLSAGYGRRAALYGIDFQLPAGVVAGMLGPNGAGKSTLLKAILGMAPVSAGWVRLFGGEPSRSRRRVAYVPQREAVDWDFPATAGDVVMMGAYGGLGWWRRPGVAERARVAACLQRVGMEGLAERRISELSGGQQQRVFLARALAQEADLYLLDEPFAGVDAATEEAIMRVFHELRDAGKTLLVVHHDLPTVRRYFDFLILLNLRLVAAGPVDEVFTAEKLREAYGARLTILSEMAEILRKEGK